MWQAQAYTKKILYTTPYTSASNLDLLGFSYRPTENKIIFLRNRNIDVQAYES